MPLADGLEPEGPDPLVLFDVELLTPRVMFVQAILVLFEEWMTKLLSPIYAGVPGVRERYASVKLAVVSSSQDGGRMQHTSLSNLE